MNKKKFWLGTTAVVLIMAWMVIPGIAYAIAQSQKSNYEDAVRAADLGLALYVSGDRATVDAVKNCQLSNSLLAGRAVNSLGTCLARFGHPPKPSAQHWAFWMMGLISGAALLVMVFIGVWPGDQRGSKLLTTEEQAEKGG